MINKKNKLSKTYKALTIGTGIVTGAVAGTAVIISILVYLVKRNGMLNELTYN
jgi:hypothetical protein